MSISPDKVSSFSPMTWEETIIELRRMDAYKSILHDSYLDEDLKMNAERFFGSDEFKETLKLFRQFDSASGTVLDIGAGNGVSTIALARSGYSVTALEPDPSETIGCGAINTLVKTYQLHNVNVVAGFGEKLPFEDNSFDIVHVRQAMHHARDLKQFLGEISRVLKPGGHLFTIRDHVIFNEKDKQLFLETHPLQKFYGGENAFLESEYTGAMRQSGLRVLKTIRYFDSVLNFAPLSHENLASLPAQFTLDLNARAKQKFGILGKLGLFQYIYRKAIQLKFGGAMDERRIPGRMYSFVATKPAFS